VIIVLKFFRSRLPIFSLPPLLNLKLYIYFNFYRVILQGRPAYRPLGYPSTLHLLMKKLFGLLLLLTFFPALAQRQDFTLEQVARPEMLYPYQLSQLSWVPGTDDYSFVQGEQLLQGNAKSGRQKAMVGLEQLNQALRLAGGPRLQTFPELRWLSAQQLVLHLKDRLIKYDLSSHAVTSLHSLPEGVGSYDLNPLTLHLSYSVGTDLFVAVQGGENVKVSGSAMLHPVRKSRPADQPASLAQATNWSPAGQQLVYFHPAQSPAEAAAAPKVGAAIFDARSGQSVALQEDPAWPYFAHLTWSPDGSQLYGVRLNQTQNQLQVATFEAAGGGLVKVLLEEKNDKFLFPKRGVIVIPDNPRQFLWLSDRDGFDHLYLYDFNGQLIRRLTRGDWSITDVLGFDRGGKTAFFVSTAESPLERHFYSLNLSTSTSSRISQGTGIHVPQLSPNATYFLNSFSSFVTAQQVRILDLSGKIRHTLHTERDPLQAYRTGEISLFPIKASDGADLYCRLITPPGFDRTRRYPVVVLLGQNLREQQVTNSWLGGGEVWMQWLAQQGYMVFTLDGRGSAHRGRDFALAPFGEAGILEGQDQLEGIDYLRSLEYVDPDRIALYGHQLGGHLAASLLLNAPALFKAGVAVNPSLSWQDYHQFYPMPPSAQLKKETDLVASIANLKRPLLLAQTEGTPASQTVQQLVKAAQAKQVPLQPFAFQLEGTTSPAASPALLRKISEFLQKEL
jgi:dipeptidyl-peptidase 4